MSDLKNIVSIKTSNGEFNAEITLIKPKSLDQLPTECNALVRNLSNAHWLHGDSVFDNAFIARIACQVPRFKHKLIIMIASWGIPPEVDATAARIQNLLQVADKPQQFVTHTYSNQVKVAGFLSPVLDTVVHQNTAYNKVDEREVVQGLADAMRNYIVAAHVYADNIVYSVDDSNEGDAQ